MNEINRQSKIISTEHNSIRLKIDEIIDELVNINNVTNEHEKRTKEKFAIILLGTLL